MIVQPSTQAPKPIAMVTPGYRSMRVQTAGDDREVRGPNRVRDELAALKGHVVYATSLLGLLHSTGAQSWQATAWKGRATSMVLDGTTTKVLSLRGTLEDEGEREDQFAGLSRAANWLADRGVRMGSLSSIAWHLWQSTLTGPVSMASLPDVGQAAFYGPRQEVREPRTYRHMSVVDLSNAYPAAMADRPYALTLREVSRATTLDPARCGLARATVQVPHDLPFSPLPVRVGEGVIQWRTGRLEGVWPWCELAHASSLGCAVEVTRCFAPMAEAQPFASWFDELAQGRALPGLAGRFMKSVGTALWGMFAMAGDHTAVVRWCDDAGQDPMVVDRPTRRLPQASTAHIAAETAARVRTQTLAEVYAMSAYPVHIDTDGVIVRRSVAKDYPRTAPAGQWRRKTEMARVEMRAPQLYRYKCREDCCLTVATNWHYVAAGMTNHQAAELFDRVATPSRVGIFGRDVVLPPQKGYEMDKLEPYLHEARNLRVALFGPGLDR